MVSTCTACRCVHALRDAGPLTLIGQDDVLLVQVIAVLDRVIIDAFRELAGPHQLITIETVLFGDPLDLFGCTLGSFTLTPEDVHTEVTRDRINFPAQRSQHCSCDAR